MNGNGRWSCVCAGLVLALWCGCLDVPEATPAPAEDTAEHDGGADSFEPVDLGGPEVADTGDVGPPDAGPPAPTVCDDELVAYWSFDEVTATSVVDASGHGEAAMVQGAPASGPGLVGEALHFDGSEAWLQLSGSPEVAMQGERVSISLWVWFDSFFGGNGSVSLFSTGHPWDGQTISLYMGANGAAMAAGQGSDAQDHSFATPIAIEAWHHVVLVLDRTLSRATVWVDGAEVDTWDFEGALSEVTMLPKLVSNNHTSNPNDFLMGRIDEVKIFTSNVSGEWIASEYAAYSACASEPCAAPLAPPCALVDDFEDGTLEPWVDVAKANGNEAIVQVTDGWLELRRGPSSDAVVLRWADAPLDPQRCVRVRAVLRLHDAQSSAQIALVADVGGKVAEELYQLQLNHGNVGFKGWIFTGPGGEQLWTGPMPPDTDAHTVVLVRRPNGVWTIDIDDGAIAAEVLDPTVPGIEGLVLRGNNSSEPGHGAWFDEVSLCQPPASAAE